MNKLILLITATIIILTTFVHSQTADLPIAATDGLWAAKVNPAALSFGNADGLGFMQNFNNDKFLRQYSIFANFKHLGYVYNRFEGIGSHRLNISANPFRNFYLGANLDWGGSDFKAGATGLSALFRPWDFISLASVNTFYNDDSDMNIYKQGIAIRPMALFKEECGYKIALTIDTYYTKQLNLDGKETKFASPIYGVQLEPLDGIRLGVAYNSEAEHISANIGFSLGGDGFSGTLLGFDKDNEFTTGSEYIHFASEDFKTIDWRFGKKNWYELNLNKPVVDKNRSFRFGPFLITTNETIELADLVNKLKDIAEDKSIDGVLVKADGFATNFANYLELETAFNNLKTAGKKVVFYYSYIGNVNYAFAASIADEIYLNPNGGVNITGMTIQQPYMKALLDTLGIEFVNFRSHKYKSAANLFSEEAMTDAEREVFNDLLTGMMDEYKRMINSGREEKITVDLDTLINNGPYLTPNMAMELNLVDKLVYEEDLEETLEEIDGKVKIVKDYYHSKRRYTWAEEPSKNIAIIYAQGTVHSGSSNPGESVGSSTFANAIKTAREDKCIDGIILRVNSGGGSAIASDIISHQLEKTSQGENKKPIVASFGGTAASGGYYIGSYADYIIAQPVTMTGSIGVYGIVFNAEKLLEKIHINVDGVKKGKHANMGSWTHSMTDEEKEKVQKAVVWYYERFSKVVADGRGMDIEAVHEVAQGRIWTGKKALELGLVDELGGMQEASNWMKKELNTGKLIFKEFEGQDNEMAIRINAQIPGIEAKIPFIPESLVEQYLEYRNLFKSSNEVAYYLAPIMMNTTMK